MGSSTTRTSGTGTKQGRVSDPFTQSTTVTGESLQNYPARFTTTSDENWLRQAFTLAQSCVKRSKQWMEAMVCGGLVGRFTVRTLVSFLESRPDFLKE